MKTKNLFIALLASSLMGGLITLGGYKLFLEPKSLQSFETNQNTVFARYYDKDTTAFTVPEGLNFVYASTVVRPTVVHVRCSYDDAQMNKKTIRTIMTHFSILF